MHFLNAILNYIYPKRCVFCMDFLYHDGDVCAECWRKVFWISRSQTCKKCGIPIKYQMESTCEACSKMQPVFDRAMSVFLYDDFSKLPILRLKNNDTTYLASIFAQWIYVNIAEEIDTYDLIIPVPVHKKKLRKRKYNQTGLISRHLSKISKVQYAPFILEKVIETLPQEGLTRDMRLKNLKGAFRANSDVKGKSVILVDDVMTTGATVNECSAMLKQSGAEKILVATVARVR